MRRAESTGCHCGTQTDLVDTASRYISRASVTPGRVGIPHSKRPCPQFIRVGQRRWTTLCVLRASRGAFMSVEENKTVIHREFDELWNQGNLDAIDELFTQDFICGENSPATSDPRSPISGGSSWSDYHWRGRAGVHLSALGPEGYFVGASVLPLSKPKTTPPRLGVTLRRRSRGGCRLLGEPWRCVCGHSWDTSPFSFSYLNHRHIAERWIPPRTRGDRGSRGCQPSSRALARLQWLRARLYELRYASSWMTTA